MLFGFCANARAQVSFTIDNNSTIDVCVSVYEADYTVNLSPPGCIATSGTATLLGTYAVSQGTSSGTLSSSAGKVIWGATITHDIVSCKCTSGVAKVDVDVTNRLSNWRDCNNDSKDATFDHVDLNNHCSFSAFTISD